MHELTATLREWAVIWRKLYMVSFPLGLGAHGLIPGLSACLFCCKAVLCKGQPHVSLRGVGASYLDYAMVGNQQVPIPQSRVIAVTDGGGSGYNH